MADADDAWVDLARLPESFRVRSVQRIPIPAGPDGWTALGCAGLQFGCLHRHNRLTLNIDLATAVDDRGARTERGGLYRLDDASIYLQRDALEPLPFGDNTFAFAFAEHFISHLDLAGAKRWLTEVRRVLAPGGFVRITTTDLKAYIDGYNDPQRRFFREHSAQMEAIGFPPMPSRPAFMINQIFLWSHRWIYDAGELRHVLAAAGFPPASIRQCAFRDGRDARVYGLDWDLRKDESLYIEADKPAR
jgi:SAM-dependent methyltransferase